MRFFPILLALLAGCVDRADEPSSCEPDLSLAGFPGVAGQSHSFLLTGGAVVERCIRLDTSHNDADVSLDANLVFSAFPISLRGANGVELATGAGAVHWTMPQGQVLFVILEFAIPDHIASTTQVLELDFAELPQ